MNDRWLKAGAKLCGLAVAVILGWYMLAEAAIALLPLFGALAAGLYFVGRGLGRGRRW